MLTQLIAGQPAQQRAGVRRLLVVSGAADWTQQRAQAICDALPGDWLWISESPPAGAQAIAAVRVKTLLGRETGHAVYDARRGLDVEALAMLAGTQRAGSWLLLLAPAWADWARCPDADSLRWSEHNHPLATPRFITHLQRQLLNDPEAVVWRQDRPAVFTPLHSRPEWAPANGHPTAGQQRILARLLHASAGIFVLTAPRGRGKSALAGMLARRWSGSCWICAPARAATDILQHYADNRARFFAPDALLQHCEQMPDGAPLADWLLIDEAAAIPSARLRRLLRYFPRLLLTTTVEGYEGTGRGFLLKFCASLPHWQSLMLDEPLRWAGDDPLERWLDNLLLLQEPDFSAGASPRAPVNISSLNADRWSADPALLRQYYGLLCSAHYRTSPLDLRRLLDAPGMRFSCAAWPSPADGLAGALWLVDEGGLSAGLAHEVWAGRRRPRGNLVAQSLAAHGGMWQAPMLRSRRITRIAVRPDCRRVGIGRQLVIHQRLAAQGLDYLSVSFGYQPDLWRFWHECGFRLARIGSHLEASSGCYSAMALLPLSPAGEQLVDQAERQLARDWYWLRRYIPLTLPLPEESDNEPDEADWRELAGFAFAHRPLQASLAALHRLASHTSLALPALRLLLDEGLSNAVCAQRLQLSGKKALLLRWRAETALALQTLDDARCGRWQAWVRHGPDDAV
ncbi:tRNA(Met) cytidine acetyltransferase [Affinibrenneria salicis]|uniref:tRNA(Met) cytidine acetyltransferase TmcA n=1 Tax=Affinibrenneria salicis TaxID=2590031 RepID=A0A5J5G040_9GAMM|nr:GNAT family N-acetyltransferase [Affinibrenneria salicis]KAA8999968.1 tRNA(Met) cytidine acetyltransferase [Affinibrenneria salicis]